MRLGILGRRGWQALMVVAVATAACLDVSAREYNQTEGIAPEQRVKIDKAVAKSHVITDQIDTGGEGTVFSEGEVNTDCGELSIGKVETEKRYGRSQRLEVDRDIIITGDVINVATDCKRNPR